LSRDHLRPGRWRKVAVRRRRRRPPKVVVRISSIAAAVASVRSVDLARVLSSSAAPIMRYSCGLATHGDGDRRLLAGEGIQRISARGSVGLSAFFFSDEERKDSQFVWARICSRAREAAMAMPNCTSAQGDRRVTLRPAVAVSERAGWPWPWPARATARCTVVCVTWRWQA